MKYMHTDINENIIRNLTYREDNRRCDKKRRFYYYFNVFLM